MKPNTTRKLQGTRQPTLSFIGFEYRVTASEHSVMTRNY